MGRCNSIASYPDIRLAFCPSTCLINFITYSKLKVCKGNIGFSCNESAYINLV
ncbi:MAG: hypothetical protein LIO87_08180 [Eubacterium sp.]|nr:hypothetical protein [Eubacterium sp.]